MGQRRNNIEDMTISEHLEKMRDDVCSYACKYMEKAERESMKAVDDFEQRMNIQVALDGKCEECPFRRLGT